MDESADENIIVTISESEFDVDGSDCDLKVAIVNQKIKILQVFCERCIHKLKWKKVDDDSYIYIPSPAINIGTRYLTRKI